MTRDLVRRIAAVLASTIVLAASTTAGAQAPDPRWNDWLGCWNLVADGNVARLPPAEDAAGGAAAPARPNGNRDARVCVGPSPRGAELRTFVDEQQVLSQTIIADGADHPVADGGCTGTQRAQWSSDGLRLFTRAQVTCEGQPARTVTGLALIAPDGQWVDVQAVTIGGTDSVRVRRFRPSTERARAGVPAAAVRLQVEHVKEASAHVSPRAIEAALLETSARFPLSARVLVDLDRAGVDDRVTDLMVALSYPEKFAVRPSAPDDRLAPFPTLPGSPDYLDASLDHPYFFGPPFAPYYSNYFYSPYFYSPFGYSYLQYYPYAFYPSVVYVPVGGGGGGGDIDLDNRPPENGRAINGLGYTRVDRRDGSVPGGGGPTPRSGAASGGRVSRQGYTAGADAGASSSSSGSSSSSSSGSSSSGSSSGSSSRVEQRRVVGRRRRRPHRGPPVDRTPRPRPPGPAGRTRGGA